MFCSGFKFGMLLQLSVGPVCFFLLQCAAALGFWKALPAVFGVAAADACYILAATCGVGALFERRRALRLILGRAGALVLCAFGAFTLWQVWRGSASPVVFALQDNVFAQAALLTLSNPLTILFWTGVFAARVAASRQQRAKVAAFSAGALFAAICFLTLVVFLGAGLQAFFTPALLRGLNGAIACTFFYFGWNSYWQTAR